MAFEQQLLSWGGDGTVAGLSLIITHAGLVLLKRYGEHMQHYNSRII